MGPFSAAWQERGVGYGDIEHLLNHQAERLNFAEYFMRQVEATGRRLHEIENPPAPEPDEFETEMEKVA
jgi:hypothetical protein